jgi:hypothetical protein
MIQIDLSSLSPTSVVDDVDARDAGVEIHIDQVCQKKNLKMNSSNVKKM